MRATWNLAGTHRPWEDWLSMGLGVLIVISPWLAHAADSQFVVLNAVTVGMLVLAMAWMELMVLRPSEEWFELAFGLWLSVSPWIFGYSQTTLSTMHVVLGLLVAALALLELRQDGNSTHAAH